MKQFIPLMAFFFMLPLTTKADMDCIYTSSQKGITIKYTSPCFDQKYQDFIDSFLYNLLAKFNRKDTLNEILILVNYEQLYRDDNSKYSNFISVGYDTIREMDQDAIITYFYKNYGTSEESRLNPVDVNFTDKTASKKKGVKIVYNYDYRLGPPIWSDIEKLILFAATDLDKIKTIQKADTVRHYSCYVTLPTIDTLTINKVLGKSDEIIPLASEPEKGFSSFWVLLLAGIILPLFVTKLINQHSS